MHAHTYIVSHATASMMFRPTSLYRKHPALLFNFICRLYSDKEGNIGVDELPSSSMARCDWIVPSFMARDLPYVQSVRTSMARCDWIVPSFVARDPPYVQSRYIWQVCATIGWDAKWLVTFTATDEALATYWMRTFERWIQNRCLLFSCKTSNHCGDCFAAMLKTKQWLQWLDAGHQSTVLYTTCVHPALRLPLEMFWSHRHFLHACTTSPTKRQWLKACFYCVFISGTRPSLGRWNADAHSVIQSNPCGAYHHTTKTAAFVFSLLRSTQLVIIPWACISTA